MLLPAIFLARSKGKGTGEGTAERDKKRTASTFTVSSRDPPNRSNFVKWENCRKYFFNIPVKISFINQISRQEFLALSKDNLFI